MRMLFINLQAQDLTASRAFYTALGFSINEAFSDEQTLAVVLDDDIALMLRTPEGFAPLVDGAIGDPAHGPTVVNCLTVDSAEAVDAAVDTALQAGGRPWLPARSDKSSYTGSFTDPDGNVWQMMFSEPLHVID